jgi:hypothetical protein
MFGDDVAARAADLERAVGSLLGIGMHGLVREEQ